MKTLRYLLVATLFFTIAMVYPGCSKKVVTQEPTVPTEQKPLPPAEPEKTAPVALEETPVQKEVLSFKDVNFDFDKFDIRSDARDILTEHARKLIANPTAKVQIEGHCDERGTVEYNLALGEKRAASVKTFLVNYGVKADQLTTISYGKERPIDTRHNEEAWAKNRRAVFVFKE